jgi:hypothetical protein
MKHLILMALILAVLFNSGYSQGIMLAVNLSEGCRFKTETTVNMVVEQEFMGIRYNTQMDISTLMHMQVLGLDIDSNYIITASYQKMNIHVTSLLINMEVSTESTASGDSLSIILRTLLGKEFKIFLSAKNEISDITGLDEMLSETIKSCKLPIEQKDEFARNLIQSLGKDAVLDKYRANRSFYPDFRVKAPAQWDFQMNLVKSGIPMVLYSQIRLKSINRNIALMVTEGTIKAQNQKEEQNLIPSINNLGGTEVSEIKMDIKTGVILESTVSQNVSGSIRTPSENTNDQGNIIPFKMNSRISILTSLAK